jgi:hypothetical protein
VEFLGKRFSNEIPIFPNIFVGKIFCGIFPGKMYKKSVFGANPTTTIYNAIVVNFTTPRVA